MSQTSSPPRPVPVAPDAEGNYESAYEGYHVNFWRKPWVQTVLPWTTSVGVHLGIIALAVVVLASGAFSELLPTSEVQSQATIPTTVLAKDNIGGVPNVGNLDDVTSENKSLDPVADSQDFRNQGEGDTATDLLTPTAGGSNANSISGITGMGALSDALGGGGGDGARLFGEAGGGGGFMGIDIGRPGDGGAARRIVFISDSSGSMEGEPKWLLINELKKAIEPLEVDQSFNVLFFRGGEFAAAFDRELKPATRRFKQETFDFLDGLIVRGETDPRQAIEAAFAMEPDLIFFLTDGRFNQRSSYDDIVALFNRLNSEKTVPVNTIQFINRDEGAEQVLRKIAFDSGSTDATRGIYRYISKDDL